MKTYLNQDERQIATFYSVMYGLIDTRLKDKNITNNMSDGEVTSLKYTRTYLEKYIKALVDRVGIKEGDRIYRNAQNNKVELIPRGTDNGQMIVDKDCLEEVCRMAVETHCFGCKNEDYHNCHLRRCMDDMGVGSINDSKGNCEFRFDE